MAMRMITASVRRRCREVRMDPGKEQFKGWEGEREGEGNGGREVAGKG
jgi:hypothetical protein